MCVSLGLRAGGTRYFRSSRRKSIEALARTRLVASLMTCTRRSSGTVDRIARASLAASSSFFTTRSLVARIGCLRHGSSRKANVFCTPARSDDQRAQGIPRDEEAALDELDVALERAVFVLDRDVRVVADGVQGRDEAVPAHLAEAR